MKGVTMHDIVENQGSYLGIRLAGTIDQEEYKNLMNRLRTKLKTFDHIDLLVDFTDCDRITLGALWEDLKFDLQNFRAVRNFAIVGNSDKLKMLDPLSEPFVSGEAKFFKKEDEDKARKWVH
ncbi:MAG TPA: hypothetical protein DCL41_04400 [Bdellovibrionales bacterium]|nr:hypothetical protein [Pseudobdellovibrionaceae bacterium]HAG91085.1 hypothetical protein [Bdellovibrionales bacterium]|tara:strand:- start:52 stop:417 length:366 start_codon:yes stop_codon:yes gene_type:complete